jgi:hypothetical protein
MADADVWPDSLVDVVDWATGAAAGRRLPEADAAALRDEVARPDAVDPVAAWEAAAWADPDDELEPPVSA